MTYVTSWAAPDWTDAMRSPTQRIAVKPSPYPGAGLIPVRLRPALADLRNRRVSRRAGSLIDTDVDPFFDGLGDVVHFPAHRFARTTKPSLYCVHDLLHRHWPQFLPPREVERREANLSFAIEEATIITTHSKWAASDVVANYEVAAQEVRPIPIGASTDNYPRVEPGRADAVIKGLGIEGEFALYPAQTWPHKNHIRLIDAMKIAIAAGSDITLICTGAKNEHWPQIEDHIHGSGVEGRVVFTGYVKEETMVSLYSRARMVVFPSLFEGGGLPILEALRFGVPLTCSNVTSIPEYAGEAAHYFDPLSTEEIANALIEVNDNEELRDRLSARASNQIGQFDWGRSARVCVDLYREVAGA